MLQFTTSQRGKRILIFEDEKFNETRFNEKNRLTNWRCSKRPCESQVLKNDDLFGKKKSDFLHSVLLYERTCLNVKK